ncbi:acyl-CoA dehydrogenase family protein [Kocuria sp. KD4]|uniref:acyl-CoA dehydrogenase family protein n=1 Tax=Kocuria sp. KD4 TaxID=2719588 RepID=UPI001F0F2B59|nr:acyl-CoA dehydrogenase family protein [Kocuria sp. KD4]
MEEIARGDFNAGSDAGNPRMTARRTDDGWVINGTKAVSRGLMRCKDVLVPREHLIGPGGAGFTRVMKGFDFSRALIGMQCVGTAEQTVAETWEYVSHRDAVDKPLSSFQSVAFPSRRRRSSSRPRGCRSDKPLEQRLRDVLGLQIADGTPQIMELIISRESAGREYAP